MTTQRKAYSIYEAMPRYPNFYQNPLSKKILFKKNIKGKTVKIACKTTLISEAKSYVDQKLIELLSSTPAEDLRKRKGVINPTISEIWKDLMEERSVRSEASTMKGYESSWVYGIEPFWGNLVAKEVDPLNVTKFENWYLKNNSTRVFFNTHKHLGMLFRYMFKQDYIKSVPPIRDLDEIIIKKTKKKKVGRVYTDDEFASLLEHAVNERTRIGIMIYRKMGARKMEILKSERAHWDLKNKVATIWSYKNKKWREVAIPDDLIKPIERFISNEPKSKFLFCAPTDPTTHLSSQVFDKSWAQTKVKAGLKDALTKNGARIHDLRHTFATWTALSGWPITLACKVLDMSVEEYSRTYVHLSNEDVRLKMNSAGSVLK